MIVVVPHVKVPSNQLCNTPSGPGVIGEVVLQGTLPQEGAQLLELDGNKLRWSSDGDRCVKSSFLPQTDTPVGNGL